MVHQQLACHGADRRNDQENPQEHPVQPGDPFPAVLLRLFPRVEADVGTGEAEVHDIQVIHHRLHQLIQPIFILAENPRHEGRKDQIDQDRDRLRDHGKRYAPADLPVHRQFSRCGSPARPEAAPFFISF